jgi:hypothetical protein
MRRLESMYKGNVSYAVLRIIDRFSSNWRFLDQLSSLLFSLLISILNPINFDGLL